MKHYYEFIKADFGKTIFFKNNPDVLYKIIPNTRLGRSSWKYKISFKTKGQNNTQEIYTMDFETHVREGNIIFVDKPSACLWANENEDGTWQLISSFNLSPVAGKWKTIREMLKAIKNNPGFITTDKYTHVRLDYKTFVYIGKK